ncbi:hypothetical protein FQR65_LT11382 [Abscondita terminalis]|nr:hypothetical protein FQR65_LT11382 [Abscondita terminalis]
MNMPQNVPNCPPGLEYLTTIDQLLVHQKVELLEAFTGFETANKYTVKNSLGQKVYYAVEDTDCCTRNCCGPRRPFDMKILDNYSNEVIHLNRPLRCDSCWFPCCLQSIEVSSPPGTLVGTVEQEWSICCPTYAIKNAAGDTVLRIEGPFCTMSICGDVEFQVMSTDGSTQVGKISKQWSGMIREMFTDADYFGITFPIDLDVKMKAVMLGACFLIDAMFFEKSQNKENDSPGMLHWKRIWMTVSGRRDHIGSIGASSALNLVKSDLINGIAMYKPYSESSYKLCLEKLPSSEETLCQKMLHYISVSMDLDPIITWAMICNYLKFECYVEIENVKDIEEYLKYHPKFNVDMWQFYTLERMFLLKILFCIVENCRNKDHRFVDLYRKFVDEVSMKTIRENLLTQFSLTSKNVDLENRESYLNISDWTERNSREQLQILFIILTTLVHEKCDVNGFIQLLKSFKEQNYVFIKAYYRDKATIAKSSTLESIRNVEVAIVLASLEDFWENPEMWYFCFKEIGSEIDELVKKWNSVVLLLAWVALHLTVPFEIAMPNYELQLQSYLRRALESNVFLDLREIVSNDLFKDCKAGVAVKVAIFSIFEVLCIKLGGHTIYDHEGTVTLLEKLLQVPEIAVVWHEGSDEGAKSFYTIATSLFPLHFHPLSICVRSLISVKCDTASIVNGLSNLQLYAEMKHRELVLPLGTKEYALKRPYQPLGNDLVVFERGTKVYYENRNNLEVARIHGRYSYFKVLLHVVDSLLKLIQSHTTNQVMEKCVESGYNIVLDILKIQPSLVAENPDLELLIKYSFYLLKAVSIPRVKNPTLVALCFEILVCQFDINPNEVIRHLNSMQFVPTLLKDSYSIEDFANLHILSLVSINDYTSDLFSSSSCDLVCIYVKLVKKSIKSRLFVDEIILPGLMFLITKIFPRFSTQFTGDNEITRKVCCKLISLCHLVLQQDRMALEEKELLYVDSVINLFMTNKLYTATLVSLFCVRNVQLELILSFETNYMRGPLLKFVKSVKKGLQCISYILNYMYLNNHHNYNFLELYLWEVSPNGSILSHIAEYKLNSFDNEIPQIAWNVLTNFALISRKPLLQTFSVGSREIRQWIMQSLHDPLLSDNVKIAIINMIKTCIYEQASMIVAVFNIEDQLEPEMGDSVTNYMSDYISNIGKDATILSQPLQLTILELFHVLWNTNKTHIIKRIRDGELFWKLMSTPLLKSERIPLEAPVLSFEIFILELCHAKGNFSENYSLAIADMFETSNKFVESWINRAIAITQIDNLNIRRPDPVSPAIVVVTVLKKFLLVSRRFYPVYEFRWNTHALEKKCLETLLYCCGHSQNRELITKWADLSLVFSTHRNRNETEMLEILEYASKILSAHVDLYKSVADINKLTTITLIYVLLKDSFEVISRHSTLIERFLHPLIKLFYFEYTIISMEDEESKRKEGVYYKWVMIVAMINSFLQMDFIDDFKHLFSAYLYLDKVFDVLYLLIKNKLPSKIAEVTMATLISYANTKMIDHFDFYYKNITYRLISSDMYKFDVNSLKWGVIPKEVQEHWRLYTQVIRLNEILLRKRGSFVVEPLILFVERHQTILKNAIMSVTVVLTETNLLLTHHILHFVHDLLQHFSRWPTNNSFMFESILNCIYHILGVASHVLLLPTIVLFKIEPNSFTKVPQSKIPSHIVVGLINRYLEIVTWGLMCLNQSNPPFYKLLDVYQDTNFRLRVKYDLHFPTLTGASHEYLSFNILLSILQFLCNSLTYISAIDKEFYGDRVFPPDLGDYVAITYPWNKKGDMNSVMMMFDDALNEAHSPQINWFSRLNPDILMEALSALGTFLATQIFLSTRDASLGYDEIYYMKRQLCSELICFYKFVNNHVTQGPPRTRVINEDHPHLFVDVYKVCCDEERERISIRVYHPTQPLKHRHRIYDDQGTQGATVPPLRSTRFSPPLPGTAVGTASVGAGSPPRSHRRRRSAAHWSRHAAPPTAETRQHEQGETPTNSCPSGRAAASTLASDLLERIATTPSGPGINGNRLHPKDPRRRSQAYTRARA